VAAHSWRKTTATVLDTIGATARLIAASWGTPESMSRVSSWAEDRSIRAPSRPWEPSIRASCEPKVMTKAMAWEVPRMRDAFSLVREPTRGLEPLTPCLQDRCAANCATPAGACRSRRGRSYPRATSAYAGLCLGAAQGPPTPLSDAGLDASAPHHGRTARPGSHREHSPRQSPAAPPSHPAAS
jgi:hypothetical protein